MTRPQAWMMHVLALGLALFTSRGAKAHRLDEYLQQTLITLEPARVVLGVHLTPGVEVAPTVIATIDTDRDGALSKREWSTYANTVLSDLVLSVNGVNLPLRLVDASYPSIEATKEGLGTLSITVEASVRGGLPSGSLLFVNGHRVGAHSTFLANAFLPRSSAIHVGAQTRNLDQSRYELELTREAPTPAGGTWPFALVLGGAGLLTLWITNRRHRASRIEARTR